MDTNVAVFDAFRNETWQIQTALSPDSCQQCMALMLSKNSILPLLSRKSSTVHIPGTSARPLSIYLSAAIPIGTAVREHSYPPDIEGVIADGCFRIHPRHYSSMTLSGAIAATAAGSQLNVQLSSLNRALPFLIVFGFGLVIIFGVGIGMLFGNAPGISGIALTAIPLAVASFAALLFTAAQSGRRQFLELFCQVVQAESTVKVSGRVETVRR